jgi:hypothetical protein
VPVVRADYLTVQEVVPGVREIAENSLRGRFFGRFFELRMAALRISMGGKFLGVANF